MRRIGAARLRGRIARSQTIPATAEINAGPPLTLAPIAVIVARSGKKAELPEQLSDDRPAVQALLARAAKALHAGQLVGDKNSGAGKAPEAMKNEAR
ncbi:MAG: hypothetical protein WDW38_006441 [Sanguina aurantia]